LPELVCDTSAIQYLHQLGLLHVLPALAERVIVPPAVIDELRVGRRLGIELPDLSSLDWVSILGPTSKAALSLVNDLGPGEIEVLTLALELRQAIAVLDDALARRVAETLGLPFTGTLGILLDAKKAGLVPALLPLLDQLEVLRFRIAPYTRIAVLKMAGEEG
jgi:predicted nucleic acid-binding protein